jgi:hypothetical protein
MRLFFKILLTKAFLQYRISYHVIISLFLCLEKGRPGGPFKNSYYLISHLGLVIFEKWRNGGRAAGFLFENIAGNQFLQFNSNLKAHVEALTNLVEQRWQVGASGMAWWARSVKSRFSARFVLVNFFDFYLTQSIFILRNLLLLHSISSFIWLLIIFYQTEPCKTFWLPAIFWPQKRYKTTPVT